MKHDILNLLRGPASAGTPPTLVEMGITQANLEQIDQWATHLATGGQVATYIPELAQVQPDRTGLAVGDCHGSIERAGSGAGITVSIQSVVKVYLYIYALEQGLSPRDIASIEAPAAPFNSDQVMRPELRKTRPGHPLNNAGAISSAAAIENFDDFLNFMRAMTGDSSLSVMEAVWQSEEATNDNNRAMAYRMVAAGRFDSRPQGETALAHYTRACSIGVTAENLTRAAVVLARGGVLNNRQFIRRDHVVRAINAMNSYGLYEQTAELSLLAAGTRALSCKSGVGGLIMAVDPGRGAFTTYGPRLDRAGNSIYGKYALIPLNHLLSAPNAMRLSTEELMRSLTDLGIR